LGPALALAALGFALVALAGAASAAADLQVTNADVSISVQSPTQGNTVTLTVTVANTGDTNATGFTVGFYLDSTATQIASVAAGLVPVGGSTNFSATWNVGATSAGAHSLIAWADSSNGIVESSDGNNQGTISFDVNRAPTATIAVNTTSHNTFEPFAFDGSGASDPDGTITSYFWVFDDGTTGTGATINHAFSDGGPAGGKAYTVTVIATDDDGGIDTAQISVNVINRGPTANAAPVSGLTKTALVFDGSSSFDPDGRIVNATWVFSDGVTRYGLTILRTFDDDGAYTATLTVRDDDGATDPVSIESRSRISPPCRSSRRRPSCRCRPMSAQSSRAATPTTSTAASRTTHGSSPGASRSSAPTRPTCSRRTAATT
jgi:uncharacterized repeat protein (TIGR01451 family)